MTSITPEEEEVYREVADRPVKGTSPEVYQGTLDITYQDMLRRRGEIRALGTLDVGELVAYLSEH